MPRLTDFPGFSVVSKKGLAMETCGEEGYNPFADDIAKSEKPQQKTIPIASLLHVSTEPSPITPSLETTVGKDVKEEETFTSFFTKPPTVTIAPSPDEVSIPMIQPRSKDGQRLLYKHPHCPRVGPKGVYTLLVGQSDESASAWLLQFDGGANPNPGPTSAGAVLWTPIGLDGKRSVAFEAGKFCGKATNNIGEAQGLLLGLQIAATRGARELLIEGDSELIIFQQTGQYKVSNANLKRWWAEIQAAMMDETCFDWIAIRQVPREFNERADSITKEVLMKKSSFTRA